MMTVNIGLSTLTMTSFHLIPPELSERISYRNELRAVGFNERLVTVTSRLNGTKDSRGQEMARQESIDRLSSRGHLIKFVISSNLDSCLTCSQGSSQA
jgi:hypothetical protein